MFRKRRFKLGQTVATPGALEALREEDDPIINEIVEEARTLSQENRKQLLIFARFLRGQK